jgi:hypothetical protein
MLFQVLADLVLLLHASFIVFVVFGALFAIRWPRIAWLHLPACVWAAVLEFFGFICPLTPLENQLRRAGGEAPYAEGFIEHYLVPFVYPPGLTPRLQVLLGVLVVLVNGLLYWYVFRYRRSRARVQTPSA